MLNCGLCGDKVYFWQRVTRMMISGLVHRSCAVKFNHKSIIKQMRWASEK